MIALTVDTRRARVTEKETITIGSVGIQVQFTFSDDWDGLARVACFMAGTDGEQTEIALPSTNTCVIPSALLVDANEDEPLMIGAFGVNTTGSIVIPTVWASAGTIRDGVDAAVSTQPPSPEDYWSSVLALATEATDTADEAVDIAGDAFTASTRALEKVEEIDDTIESGVSAIEEAGATQVQNVNDAGDAKVEAVNLAGSTQIAAVNSAGASIINALPNTIAANYSASSTYAVGDHVLYNNALYQCKTAIETAEEWTAEHWTAVKVADEVSDLNRQISDVEENQIPELKSALDHYCIDGGDLSGFEKPCVIINDKWGLQTGKHLSIPIGDATEVFLHSNSLKKCIYAFLTDDTVVVGGTPPFVSGTSVYELAKNASATVIVPGGAKYLYLNYLYSTDNYLPSELKFDGINFYTSFRSLIYNNGVVAEEAHQITGKMEAIEKVPDYYIALNTDPVNISEPVTSTGIYSYSIVNCFPGDIFTINATGGNAPRAYAFIDDNNHVIEKASASSTYQNFTIIAPLGAVKLIINDNSGSTSYKGATLNNRERFFNNNLLYREIYPLTDSSKLSINSSAYSATFDGTLGPVTATGEYVTDLHLTCSWGDEKNPGYIRFIMFNKQKRILVAVSRYADEMVLADLIANPTNYAILAVYHQQYNAYRFTSSSFPGHWYIDGVDVYSQAIDTIAQTKALSVKAFRRVGCIGDSYTEGYINIGGGSVTIDKNYAWPHYMESITGNVWTNFGKSGSSCKSWVDGGAYSNLMLVQADGNKCQAYVIGLMINDSDPNAHAYVAVGTPSDIGTEENTYYAYYYRLIQAVHAVNAEAPIFCATCPRTESRFSDYNAAVRRIVTYCQNENLPVFLLDLAGSKYNTTEYYKHPIFSTDYINGHYTAIGYELMAECYVRVISDVINENISSFKNIHLIDYDVAT